MKKLFILTMLLGLLGVTGCNKAEANVAETEMETVTVCEETNEADYWTDCSVAEDKFEAGKCEAIACLKTDYEDGHISEECMNEAIELIESLEYDPAYVDGYDYDALMISYISILQKYNYVPSEYDNMTAEEIYESLVYVALTE